MKRIFPILMALLVLTLCTSATLKKGDKKKKDVPEQVEVYGFGFAASFVDTLAYYTQIQKLDSAQLVDKRYLDQRYQYSYQLKEYLEGSLQKYDYVCMIFFSPNLKKLQKDFDKLVNKYQKSGVGLKSIAATEFQFEKTE